MNFLASAVLVAFGVIFATMAAMEGQLWPLMLALALIPVGAWMMLRSLLMRVSFDAESLHIVGLFRSRRIPRAEVLSVEQRDLDMPMIQWAPPGSTDRWSIMSPLILGSGSLVPSSMYRRRHRFLARLRMWAPDADTDAIRPGWWSQVIDGLGRALLAVWRSPRLRLAFAIVLIGLAAAAYWFAWVTLTEVSQGTEDFHRGQMASAVVAGLAAEWAYWLLPLRKRRTRLWHIALGVALAPLAVVLLLALFA